MLRVIDGDPRVIPWMHYLDSFRRCDLMLDWLVRSNLVGKEFVLWSQFNFGASMLGMAKYVLQRLDKEREGRPVLLGRDVVPD